MTINELKNLSGYFKDYTYMFNDRVYDFEKVESVLDTEGDYLAIYENADAYDYIIYDASRYDLEDIKRLYSDKLNDYILNSYDQMIKEIKRICYRHEQKDELTKRLNKIAEDFNL